MLIYILFFHLFSILIINACSPEFLDNIGNFLSWSMIYSNKAGFFSDMRFVHKVKQFLSTRNCPGIRVDDPRPSGHG